MKIKVIQFDTRINNETIEFGKELNKKYCAINNYDYEFEYFKYDESKYLNIFEFFNGDGYKDKRKDFFGIAYHKYELLEQNINNYDYIVFLDSDAVFVNPKIKIEDLLNNQSDIYLSQDCTILANTFFLYSATMQIQQYCNTYYCQYIKDFKNFANNTVDDANRSVLRRIGGVWTNPAGINSGFIIMKNSNISKEFLNDCKKYYKLFENAMEDQGCIAFLLNTKKYKNNWTLLPDYIQGDSFLDHPDFKYDENKNFINHICGGGTKILEGFKLVKNNKWWREYFNE